MDNASCGANEPKICYIKGIDYNFSETPEKYAQKILTEKITTSRKSFIIQIRKLAKCKFSVC